MIKDQTFEGYRENLNQANKLSRTYACHGMRSNRHRGKGQQKARQHRPRAKIPIAVVRHAPLRHAPARYLLMLFCALVLSDAGRLSFPCGLDHRCRASKNPAQFSYSCGEAKSGRSKRLTVAPTLRRQTTVAAGPQLRRYCSSRTFPPLQSLVPRILEKQMPLCMADHRRPCKAAFASPGYAEAYAHGEKCAKFRIYAVEGLPQQ